jgi:hypothetical protein
LRPASLKILGKKWSVDYVKDSPLEKDELGICDLEKQAIHVKDGLPGEQERSTLLHETIHAISDSLGLNLNEKQVQGLETGLFDMNTRNPRLFTYLRKK